MGIIDLLIIIFVVATAVLSARKGFLMSLLDVVSYVVAGILVKTFSPSVSAYVYDSYFAEELSNKLKELLPDGKCYDGLYSVIEQTLSVVPTEITDIAKQFGIYPSESAFKGFAEKYDYFTVSMIEDRFIVPIVKGTVSVVAIILMFILFVIVLKIISVLINSILTRKNHPVIRRTNTLFGAALGVVKGCVFAMIICFAINIIAPILANDTLTEASGNSYFCNLIAELIS